MAKKKKKTTTTRRRRMSGLNTKSLTHTLMEAAGVVVGSIGSTALQTRFGSLNPKIMAAIQIFAGSAIKSRGQSPLLVGAGWGMMSAGALGMAREFKVIAGIEDYMNGLDGEMQGYEGEYLNGLDNDYNVSGMANEPLVSGMSGHSMAGAYM